MPRSVSLRSVLSCPRSARAMQSTCRPPVRSAAIVRPFQDGEHRVSKVTHRRAHGQPASDRLPVRASQVPADAVPGSMGAVSVVLPARDCSDADASVLTTRCASRRARAGAVAWTRAATAASLTPVPASPHAKAADGARAFAQRAAMNTSHEAGEAGGRSRAQPRRATRAPQQLLGRTRCPARPRRFPGQRAGGARVIVARATGGACRCGVLRFYSRHHTTEGSTTA